VIANAQVLAAGLVEEGYRVVSGGTDSHLVLVDVFAKGVRGKEAEAGLDRAYITVNKNTIPFDVNPPLNPSGVRLGSPAVTTRGFGETEMREVAALIARTLENLASEENLAKVRARVAALTERFPLYAWKLASAAVSR
jgi:glycine hydroxymethyltransferase